MLVACISDIHLEWTPTFKPQNNGADVLILAGDICVASYFNKSKDSPYYKVADQFRDFFKHCSETFEHVLYVKGNHESYKGYIDKTSEILERELEPHKNIQFLDFTSVEIGDIKFIGTTLWTNLNKGCPITESTLRYSMNDFKLIQWSYNYYKFSPMDSYKEHTKSLEYIKSECEGHNKVVVISHHAPSSQSISQCYKNDYYMNGAYYSDLEEFILERPQIKNWFHGHMHQNFDYSVGSTRVICNPKGYNKENPNFNPNNIIEI